MILSVLSKLADRVSARPHDVAIGGSKEDPYMLRWWVIPRNKFVNLYLHRFRHSDDDRALHDHPWINVSVLIRGEYTEHTIAQGGTHAKVVRRAGDWKFRRALFAHRIELHSGECWTFFATGPRIRSWGFHCPTKWVDWRIFTDPTDTGQIGRGCGENGES
jgi:hypothetical protein